MVLKYLTVNEVNTLGKTVLRDEWHFVGGITSASIYFDEGAKQIVARLEFENKPFIVLALCGEAYLLNDNGKTIEKVRC